MGLIAWNARGLGNPREFNKLRMILQTFSLSLVFISETKLYGRVARLVKDSVGYDGGIHVDLAGRSGGLILRWKKEFAVDFKGCSRGHIDVFVTPPDAPN